MSDPDIVERWLTNAFAQVEAPPGVDAWRRQPSRRAPMRNGTRRLMAVALAAGIAAALLSASVAGTLALTHSHPSPPATAHPIRPPAATHEASPPAHAAASACSRLKTPESSHGFLYFDPPGAEEPSISCAQAIATFLCSPSAIARQCLQSLPVTAQLARLTVTDPLREFPGPGLPFVGKPFVPKSLLVWRMTWEAASCHAELGPGFPPLDFTPSTTPCRTAWTYLIDASTGDFLFFDFADNASGKAG